MICNGCWQEIDPDCCGCGIEEKRHNDYEEGHSFVPMGCNCLRSGPLQLNPDNCPCVHLPASGEERGQVDFWTAVHEATELHAINGPVQLLLTRGGQAIARAEHEAMTAAVRLLCGVTIVYPGELLDAEEPEEG